MRLDLHVHSTASDGSLTAEEIVQHALEMGLEALSITDHDSVEAIPAALAAASGRDLLVVPGVELSAVSDGRDVHVLAYFIDFRDPRLLEHLSDLRSARRRRAETMVSLLAEAGFNVTLDDVLAISDGAIGRSHIARALVDAGEALDVRDAFERLIGRGRPFYVPKDTRTPAEVVRTVRELGGLPVLAHPGVTGIDELIPELVDAGLAGLEAYHAQHDDEDRLRYAAMAEDLGLCVTGGSDYHGPSAPGVPMGEIEMPDSVLECLLRAGARL